MLGIKTPKVLALVKINNGNPIPKAELLDQIEIDRKQLQKYPLTCFKFASLSQSQREKGDLQVLLGFSNGIIQLQNLKTKDVLLQFNSYSIPPNAQNTEEKPWIKKKPFKIAIHPAETKHEIIIVLFEDGVILEFNGKTKKEFAVLQKQFSFIAERSKQHNKHIQNYLKDQKQGIKQKNEKATKDIQGLSQNVLLQDEFTSMSCKFTQNSNPVSYFRYLKNKFECTTINEIEILPFNPLDFLDFEKYSQEHKVDYQKYVCIIKDTLQLYYRDYLILACTGLDGYFRIIEIRQMKPLLSFKTDYGGLQSFAFNKQYSMISLAGQDDTVYVISLEKQITWRKFVGHNSFISRSVFYEQKEMQTMRLITGSYDGFMSFTEITKDLLNQQNEDGLLQPISINGSNYQNKILKVQNKVLTNLDGVCYLVEKNNYLGVVNFDGCICLFSIMNNQKEIEEFEHKKIQQQQQQN